MLCRADGSDLTNMSDVLHREDRRKRDDYPQNTYFRIIAEIRISFRYTLAFMGILVVE